MVSFLDILINYIDLFSGIGTKSIAKILEIELKPETLSLDERIKKLEEAKISLTQALTAIDELQHQASKNKADAEKALKDLIALEKDKEKLDEQIKADKQLISTDVEHFKKMAGIPTEQEKRRDRFVGFISGVFASILATIIIALFVWGYQSFFNKKGIQSVSHILQPNQHNGYKIKINNKN